ncbi:hypothetical protein [Vibrio sp. CAU 1672]|uniref:hypothetical protein n=1 Tax=Vibrio sp. CAU 1672 TaxID=3032594 RepID=UPI0023DB96B4|nr:hypothetical protein [Vibrio sp. CAU 1672]MDF2155800.1 hypothetical protein [Vibrio sp. CAU 1672]
MQFAYQFIGIANQAEFKQARAEGKMLPFYAHEPNFKVDLDAIPFGGKVATQVALSVLGKQTN